MLGILALEKEFCCVKDGVFVEQSMDMMHYKDLLGSIAREGYSIPALDFHLVLHGLQS